MPVPPETFRTVPSGATFSMIPRIAFHATANGIAMEHVIRTGQHNMRVKHFHPEYEIFYILEGTRQFFFGNRYFTASKGDLIIIDSNMVHMTKSDETDQGHNRIILYITPEAIERLDNTYLQINLKLLITFLRRNKTLFFRHRHDNTGSFFPGRFLHSNRNAAERTCHPCILH